MSEEREERRRRKVYRADSFAMSAMTCPGCRGAIKEAVDHCPRCGYSGHTAVAKFPFPAPSLSRFIDPNGHLGEKGRVQISKALNALSKKFPQPRFCFCVLNLAPHTDPREFAFWLMNASPVDSPEEAQLRPWTILFLVDDANGRATLTSGYAIEPYLNDESWNSLLRLERQYLFARDYENVILKVIEGAEEILNSGANRAEKMMSRKKSRKRESERGRK